MKDYPEKLRESTLKRRDMYSGVGWGEKDSENMEERETLKLASTIPYRVTEKGVEISYNFV